MPFRSESQRRYLFSQEPEVAREFAAKTPKGAKLPERVHPAVKQAHKAFVEMHGSSFARNAGRGFKPKKAAGN